MFFFSLLQWGGAKNLIIVCLIFINGVSLGINVVENVFFGGGWGRVTVFASTVWNYVWSIFQGFFCCICCVEYPGIVFGWRVRCVVVVVSVFVFVFVFS